MTSPLLPAHRSFLLMEQGIGSGIFNFVVNGLIAWALFRSEAVVPLWGQQSIAGDTIGTTFLLPFLTCLIATPLARRQFRSRNLPPLCWTRASHPFLRYLPARTFLRGVVLGAVCVVAMAPFTIWLLGALGVSMMRLWPFITFKATFAAVLAVLVTPIIALWAISETEASRRP